MNLLSVVLILPCILHFLCPFLNVPFKKLYSCLFFSPIFQFIFSTISHLLYIHLLSSQFHSNLLSFQFFSSRMSMFFFFLKSKDSPECQGSHLISWIYWWHVFQGPCRIICQTVSLTCDLAWFSVICSCLLVCKMFLLQHQALCIIVAEIIWHLVCSGGQLNLE
jgi:hypothetical protein